jgi:LysM repeat protein
MTKPFPRCSGTIAAGLFCLTLSSCSGTKKTGYADVVDYTTPNTGLSQSEYPFDEKGNYLADVVAGKKKGNAASKPEPPPVKSYVDTYEKPPETKIASNSANYEVPPPAVLENPYGPEESYTSSGSTTADKPRETVSSSKPKPKSTSAAKPKPKPKPKPKAVVKAKPKPKPTPKPPSALSHTVKKGETLYGLAKRYGTTVSAIKRASGLSSDILRDGRTIKIPRK